MANSKISALTSATTVAGTEVLPIVQSSATVKVSVANLTPGLGTITAAKGGTGQTSYAIGDLLYADTTTTLAKLADVATGNALISGGVSIAPSWGKIGLTTHVSGTLPTANGGTNLTSFTSGGVVYASSTSALTTGSALVFDGANLGVGITPSAWTVFKVMQLGSTMALGGVNATSSNMFFNAYYDGSYKYIGTGGAYRYEQNSTSGHIWYTAASGTAGNAISFTQALTLDANGGLKTLNTIGVGNTAPSTSGAGITFPATQSASTNANTLDDYEEGTYTVTLTPQTSGTITLSATINEGGYTKVGRVVTITAQVGIDSVSSPIGSYIDFSIPFAIANLTDNAGRAYFAGIYQQGNAPFTTSINRVIGLETFSTVRFYITAATVAAGDELGIAFSYFTD